MNNDNNRKRAASLVRAYQENKITWQQFMDQTAELKKDNLIDELIDLVEHEPKRGGFMGLNNKEWQKYQSSIQEAIAELEK